MGNSRVDNEQPTHGDILHELRLMRDDVRDHRAETKAWRETNDRELETIRKELAANTVITTEVKNVYTTGVTITRFVRWVGYIAVSVGSVVALWWALFRNNPPPPPTIWPPQ